MLIHLGPCWYHRRSEERTVSRSLYDDLRRLFSDLERYVGEARRATIHSTSLENRGEWFNS